MRIDSCRTCGEDMKEFQTCPICRKTTRFICRKCGNTSEEQVHPDCSIMNKPAVAN